MFTIVFSVFAALIGIGLGFVLFASGNKAKGLLAAIVGPSISAIVLVFASVSTVSTSTVGVVTQFGQVQAETLKEGVHLVLPINRVHEVFTGIDTAEAKDAIAASADLQRVHSTLKINFHVIDASGLYQLNPSLNYNDTLITPAAFEVFKAVVARYSAEDLVTKREIVSAEIHSRLNEKFAKYFVQATDVNLIDFGFSKSFDEAIENKVTAKQEADASVNRQVRIKTETESALIEARGKAETIRIQAEAAAKQGGEAYVQLEAIKKWDGKLPAYMTSGAATPFVNIK